MEGVSEPVWSLFTKEKRHLSYFFLFPESHADPLSNTSSSPDPLIPGPDRGHPSLGASRDSNGPSAFPRDCHSAGVMYRCETRYVTFAETSRSAAHFDASRARMSIRGQILRDTVAFSTV